jgi:hypothetical protein
MSFIKISTAHICSVVSFIFTELVFRTDTPCKGLYNDSTLLTTLNIYNSQHSTHMLIFDKGGKPENLEKTLKGY